MILIEIFKDNVAPRWLMNMEQDLDEFARIQAISNPHIHPLNLKTEERNRILKAFRAKFFSGEEDPDGNDTKWYIRFDNDADYTMFMLKFS